MMVERDHGLVDVLAAAGPALRKTLYRWAHKHREQAAAKRQRLVKATGGTVHRAARHRDCPASLRNCCALPKDQLAKIDTRDTGKRRGPESADITLQAFGRDIPEA